MDLCRDCVSKDFKYADDLTLLAVGDTLSNSIKCLQRDIDQLVWWLKKWRIKASAEKTKAIIFQKPKSQKVEFVPALELNGLKVDFPSTIKVLGILIDSRLCFKEQFENSTNKAAQTLSVLKRSYLNVQNFKPHTLKKLCQSIVIPQWTYLAFLWGDKLKFQNSTLWSEMITLITCKSWNPPKTLLELLANLVPIDIQMESHAAKFCIKAMQQQETDPIRSLLMLNTSQIARKINADRRILGQLDNYNPETMMNQIKKRWNARLTSNPMDNLALRVHDKEILPRWLSKSQMNKIVQLLSQQSHLGSFKFKIGRCFTPICTCMLEDETADHFLTICPFYVNLRAIWQPKSIQELVWNNKEEDWKNVVRFVETAKRL